MDQQVVKKWINALESGKYEQGQGGLRHESKDGVTFCCLGVLADITTGGKGWLHSVLWENDDKPADGYVPFLNEEQNAFLEDRPTSVPADHWPNLAVQNELAEINDEGNDDFADVIDHIRETLLEKEKV